MMIQQSALCTMLLCLSCGSGWGEIIHDVEMPQDNVFALTGYFHPEEHSELKPLYEECGHFLSQRVLPMKFEDFAAVFGHKLDKLPRDAVHPLFAPHLYMTTGVAPSPDSKRHTDYHAVGKFGYIQVVYQSDGESVSTAVMYLKEDDQFVPVKTPEDIPRREAWDKAKFKAFMSWIEEHMPKITDLGEILIIPSEPSRVNLGKNGIWTFNASALDSTLKSDYFFIQVELQSTNAPAKNRSSIHFARPDVANTFRLDGKFYKITPKLTSTKGAR